MHSLRVALGFCFGVFGIACAAIFMRIALPAPPVVIGFYRMAFASGLLAGLLALRRSGIAARGGRAARSSLSRSGVLLCLAAGACFGADIALWHTALADTSVANATLLVNTTPIHVGLFTALVLRRPLGRGFVPGAAIALLGTALLLGFESGGERALRGDGLSLVAAFFYTGYLLFMSRARQSVDALSAVTAVSVAAAGVLGLAGLALGDAFHGFPARSWIAMGAAAAISQLGGVFAIVWALRYMPPTFASVALLSQPAIAALLGWLILGEALGGWQLAGGSLLLVGIAIVSRNETIASPSGATAAT